MTEQAERLPGRRQRLAHACKRAGLLSTLTGLRGLVRRDLRILAYHRVLDEAQLDGFDFDPDLVSATAADFRWQMGLVARHMAPVTFADVIAHIEGGARLPARALLVTFDDGYDDNYHVAFPILRELGVPATFFVSTGHVDSGMPYEYDWLVHMLLHAPEGEARVEAGPEGEALAFHVPARREARLALARELLVRIKEMPALAQSALLGRLAALWGMPPRPHRHCRPMTWDQLREMDAAGMEIGSHGVHHRMLAKLPREEMAWELRTSAERLAAELGHPAVSLAYPVGGPDAYDDAVIEAARANGFKAGCSYVSGTSPAAHGERFTLKRIPVERHIDRDWFEAMLALPELFMHPTPLSRD